MFPDMLGLIYPFLLISHATSSLGERQQQQEKRGITDGEGAEVKTIKVIKAVHRSPTNAYNTKLKELCNYAVLKNDLKSSLSSDFSICSIISTTRHINHYPLVLLDKDDDIFVQTYVWNADNGVQVKSVA